MFLNDVVLVFHSFSINHIFQETNLQVDSLSKESPSLPMGEVYPVEYKEGKSFDLRKNVWM
jgi:hypothetical protein